MKYRNIDLEIENVQKVEVEILKEIDRICKENKIKYHLFAGTLLGAVRHKGFIPWDDDIDICMPRADYERFVNLCESELSGEFFLQTNKTDKLFYRNFAKVRKNNTRFIEKGFENLEIHNGIFVDVFALDKVEPNTFLGNIQKNALLILGKFDLWRVNSYVNNIASPSKRSFARTMNIILKFFPKKLHDKLSYTVSTMFSKSESNYVTHLLNGVNTSRYQKYMMELSEFDDTVYLEFEGIKFPGPENYDVILSNLFGDYMKLPPAEQQKPHHGVIEVKI